MKMNAHPMKPSVKLVILALSCVFLLGISCKKEQTSTTVPVNIFDQRIPPGHTLNDSTKTDSTGIEVGLKFQSAVPLNITGVRFYKTSGNFGDHIGQLYSAGGELLASGEFLNETDSGWQSVLFGTPVPILANTTYIAAYFSSLGNYTSTDYALNRPIKNGPLTILADGTDGPNGVFKYTNSPAFPDSLFLATNYWVDVTVKEK